MKSYLCQRAALGSTLLLIIATGAVASAAPDDIRTVALLHSPLYTAANGDAFVSLALPSIDDAGHAAFRTDLGVYSEGDGPQLHEIARLGRPAPGGGAFDAFVGLNMNDAGKVAVLASVDEGAAPATRTGIWMENSTGTLSPVVQDGDAVPGVGGGVFFPPLASDDDFRTGETRFSFNAQGQVAFQSPLVGPGAIDANDRAVFVGSLNGLTMAARRGGAAPDADGAVFSIFRGIDINRGHPMPALNDSGQLAFLASLEGPGVTSANSIGAWIGSPHDGLRLAARNGDHAPGTEAHARWRLLNRLTINSAGEIAVVGYLSGGGINERNDSGIWVGAPGQMELAVRDGMPAAGSGGAVFRDLDGLHLRAPQLNGQGELAFVATLAGPGVDDRNDAGLWTRSPSSELSLVAREGDPAPGGGVFASFETFEAYASPGFQFSFNSRGQVAFAALSIFPDDPESNKRGIWAQDRHGELQLIVETGQLLEFANEPTLGSRCFEVRDLRFNDGADEAGFATSFNDRGEIVFRASSEHGTPGIYMSTRVAIPEPGSAGLVLGGLLGGLSLRRRLLR